MPVLATNPAAQEPAPMALRYILGMSVGFTGTQEGMTLRQARAVWKYLRDVDEEWFHHGDCIGSDETAHYIAKSLGYLVHIHPPINPKKRAFCEGDAVSPEKDYMARNQDIVNESELMIAAPKEDREMLYSGTWSTVRRARKKQRPLNIIYP